jgi:hypothetical protein
VSAAESLFGWPVEDDEDLAPDLTAPCPGQLPIAGEPDAGEC